MENKYVWGYFLDQNKEDEMVGTRSMHEAFPMDIVTSERHLYIHTKWAEANEVKTP
jgi:hypothetical protein